MGKVIVSVCLSVHTGGGCTYFGREIPTLVDVWGYPKVGTSPCPRYDQVRIGVPQGRYSHPRQVLSSKVGAPWPGQDRWGYPR